MPRIRDVLYRFRPAGAPGQASAAGVPADRAADLAAELEPLFARLAPVERARADLLESARSDAAAVRAEAATGAERMLARAREQVGAERADAAGAARARVRSDTADLIAAAQAEAVRLRGRTELITPGQVEHVLASVRSLIGSGELPTGPEPAR